MPVMDKAQCEVICAATVRMLVTLHRVNHEAVERGSTLLQLLHQCMGHGPFSKA